MGGHGVDFGGLVDPRSGRELLTVGVGGWTVRVDGVRVTVPRQGIAGKTAQDLRRCLDVAYARAGVPPTTVAPGWRPELACAVATVLARGRRIAQMHWGRGGHDIYWCTGRAWEQSAMAAPYTELIKALRAVLPPGTNLSEYSDAAPNHLRICELFTRASVLVAGSGARGVA